MLNALSENLITLLCYDATQAPIIRGIVDVALFGGPYRLIAARVYDYLDRFKQPPCDHIADLLADKLTAGGPEGALYADIITSIRDTYAGINAEYVIKAQLEPFIRRQSLRGVAVELTKALQRDTEESLDEAEALIAASTKQRLSVFDPGLRLSDRSVLGFLDHKTESFPIGIPELDRRGFGPTRKELWLFVGNTKSGKSFALIHLAKQSVMHHLRVLHISLEMSEHTCAQRYMQAFFALAKRGDQLPTAKFEVDQLGNLIGYDHRMITPRLSLDDPDIRNKLSAKVERWSGRVLKNIIVKQFPTGSLTVRQLKAYMDNLEATCGFIPDLLLVDYPDLMKVDPRNYRLEIDRIYQELRGIAVERNIALAVVSQSHRAAAKSKQVGADNVAEAYSKIAHADTVITYSSTEYERKLGLARLHVAGGRNDQDQITIVISQQYGIGGFVMDSCMMSQTYWGLVQGASDEA